MSFPDIHELLLHRDTMLLLDQVMTFTNLTGCCQFTPQPNAWYADSGGAMPAWFGIELMAQGIAAHVALLARAADRAPKPGVLLGTRDYQAYVPVFPPSHPLWISVTQTYRGDDGLAAYDCSIRNNLEETLASASLTVFEPENFQNFISVAKND